MADKYPLQKALEFMEDEGAFRVHEYSGRGMYGKKCLAISGDFLNPMTIGFNIAEWNEGESGGDRVEYYDISRSKQDNMGLGTVIYWPHVPYVEEEEDDLSDLD